MLETLIKWTQAFQTVGFSAADMDELIRPENLYNIRPVIINCTVPPLVPTGLSIKSHQESGDWRWNPRTFLLVTKDQKEFSLEGVDLLEDLTNQPLLDTWLLNACVLDYLLTHQNLIPESWRSLEVIFWGTIYEDGNKNQFVRSLYLDAVHGWRSNCISMFSKFDAKRPAAISS
ncbi:MAG: hypothetical protein NT165_03895 [Candidatus Falkowbacteria bacterium]|nr:hypothetical protein [Candidatus Falkowbacteria bacterium]